ncbi:MAG: hypothetical protein HQK58_16115, partial [Deltaproteobacteria bacterium]|nr:hypothetical protein [Deltaproteobacteria bacterium]
DVRELIFEKFVQARGSESKFGTGLGLTFCRMAVEAHGGHIWVDGRVKTGSTFSFTIPVGVGDDLKPGPGSDPAPVNSITTRLGGHRN